MLLYYFVTNIKVGYNKMMNICTSYYYYFV